LRPARNCVAVGGVAIFLRIIQIIGCISKFSLIESLNPAQITMNSLENRPVNVGLIGFGNIGTGVVRWFQDGGGEPFNLRLKRVAVRDLTKPRALQFSPLTDDPADILRDSSIDIVVELMGGVDNPRRIALDAIDSGKNVVTANKALLALHMKEIFDAARSRQVSLGFEASVAGGIQVINTFGRLRGERINKLMGIINGTTNYMLTRMAEEGLAFGTALKGAQEAGFAEANHILDTGGSDAQGKLAVLAALAFNAQIDVNKIPCRGITEITPIDMDFAKENGYVVKLLAMASKEGEAVTMQVTPALLKKEHPLASVRNEFNMIYIEGELAGPQTFYGRGAGEKPTSSAVISDILDVAEHIRNGTTTRLPRLDSKIDYADPDNLRQAGYIRVNLLDKPGSIAEVTRIIADKNLNIEDSIQRKKFGEKIRGSMYIPDIITFARAAQTDIKQALEGIANSDRIWGEPFFLPFVD